MQTLDEDPPNRPEPWARLADLLAGADLTALTLAVVDLSADQRREVVARLRAYVGPSKYQRTERLNEAGAAIVGAGVLPDAKSVAVWLTRYGMRHYRFPDPPGSGRPLETSAVPHVFYVLTGRGVPWLAELAGQIAQRLPRVADFGVGRFELACRLLEHTATPPPITPGFIAGWVHALRPQTVAGELAAHPGFAVLVAHFFDVDEVGAALARDDRWPAAIADVVEQGLVDRAAVLDACTARLGRDGKPGATRAFLSVHEALAPAPDEIGDRRAAYLAMVSAPVSTVASAAQAGLFDLDDRGVLPPTDQLELAKRALCRSEKKVVRAQLARIAKLTDLDADQRTEFARLIISSWAGADADIVQRGLQTITALRIPEAERRNLAGLAPADLPADLAAELRVLVGSVEAAPVLVAEPQGATRQLVRLEPVTDLDAIVAQLLEVITGDAAEVTTPQLETLIDGLLTVSAVNRQALRESVQPLLGSDRSRWLGVVHRYGYNRTLRHAVWALTKAAAGDAPTVHPRGDRESAFDPEAVLVDRVLALATCAPLPPLSVCLPSWTNGLLDPDDLLDRLGRAATGGWQPSPGELEQALLRLDTPSTEDDTSALVLAFVGLGTPAGRIAAEWIRGRLPEPAAFRRIVVTQQHTNYDGRVDREIDLVQLEIVGTAPPGSPDGIWAGLIGPRGNSFATPEDFRSPLCWPALAPRHRDLVAAHCARSLASEMDSSSRLAEVLPVLADVDGPIGEPTALALAYGLCAGRAEQRAVAQRGLALMCARPEWDGAIFGAVLGELFVRRSVVLKRAVESVRSAAPDCAPEALWPALRTSVADLLAAADGQPGLADLLALAADVAQRTTTGEPIAGLAELAARPGKSRQTIEARRLQTALSR